MEGCNGILHQDVVAEAYLKTRSADLCILSEVLLASLEQKVMNEVPSR
jgi:hypothetical protein